jgi:hypothetical protein
MQPVHFGVSKARMIFIIAFGFLLIPLSYAGSGHSGSSGALLLSVFGWVIFCMGLAGVIIGFYSIIHPRTMLTIDASGISGRLLGNKKIPWSEITNAYTISIKGGTALVLQLRNPECWSKHKFSRVGQAASNMLSYGGGVLELRAKNRHSATLLNSAIFSLARLKPNSLTRA